MKVKTFSGSTYTFEKKDGKVYVYRDSDHCILEDDWRTPHPGTEKAKYILDSMPYIAVGMQMEFAGIITSKVVEIVA